MLHKQLHWGSHIFILFTRRDRYFNLPFWWSVFEGEGKGGSMFWGFFGNNCLSFWVGLCLYYCASKQVGDRTWPCSLRPGSLDTPNLPRCLLQDSLSASSGTNPWKCVAVNGSMATKGIFHTWVGRIITDILRIAWMFQSSDSSLGSSAQLVHFSVPGILQPGRFNSVYICGCLSPVWLSLP